MDVEALAGADVVRPHQRALDSVASMVAGVGPDRMGAPTPCEGWDVRALLAHLVGGNRRYAALAESGVPLRRAPGPDGAPPARVLDGILGADPAGAYRTSADALKEVWRDAERLERTYELPFGRVLGRAALGIHLLETVAHGWDLAQATGQKPRFDPEIVDAAWRVARVSLSGERPPGAPFDPPVAPPEGATELDQLAAFLGRRG